MTYVFIKLPEVRKRTGKSKSAIYKEIKNGTFPRQVSNGENSVAWLECDIKKWQEEKIRLAANDNKESKLNREC